MSRPKSDEQDLVVRAAWQYYVHGYGQKQIARSLGLSRTKVTRLLSQARETGIVKISLEHEMVETLALGDWIAAHYGVENCILTPPLPEDPSSSATIDEISRQAVGMAAANLLVRRCQRLGKVSVGIGAGRNVGQVIDAVGNFTKSDLTAQSLVGTTHIDDGLSSYSLALALARNVGGVARTLPLPLFMGNAASRRELTGDPMISNLLEATSNTEFNLLSCGPVSENSPFAQRAWLSADEIGPLAGQHAVCEIAGLFLNADGAPVVSELDDRRIGIGWERVLAADNLIVASGRQKVGALRAVLKAGLARTIVIDHMVAAELANSR